MLNQSALLTTQNKFYDKLHVLMQLFLAEGKRLLKLKGSLRRKQFIDKAMDFIQAAIQILREQASLMPYALSVVKIKQEVSGIENKILCP